MAALAGIGKQQIAAGLTHGSNVESGSLDAELQEDVVAEAIILRTEHKQILH